MTWEDVYFEMITALRQKSKDPSSKFAALIAKRDHTIVSMGFNGFPRGIADTEERLNNRDLKYKFVVHAEQNAILNSAKVGVPLDDCVLFVDAWPCSNCAKSIIQTGISRVVLNGDSSTFNDEGFLDRWKEEIALAKGMFNEAGVEVNIYRKKND